MQRRFHALQILRAVAAWMVVYHHFMQLFFQFKAETVVGSFFARHGNFGVDVFFALSGFLMYFSVSSGRSSAQTFMQHRLVRIVPAYWFYTLVTAMCVQTFPIEFAFTDFSLSTLVKSLAFWPHVNPVTGRHHPLLTVGWSLVFEMFFYVVLAVAMLLSKSKAALIGGLFVAALPLVYPAEAVYSQLARSKLLYEFVGGLLVAWVISSEVTSSFVQRNRRMLMLLAIAAAAVAAFKLDRNVLYRPVLATCILFLVLNAESLIRPDRALDKWLIRLGNWSYSTYLLHVLVLGVALHFSGAQLGTLPLLLLFVVLSLTIAGLSALSFRLIETPFIRMVAHRRAQKPEPH